MKSITDPTFNYVPSVKTDIRKTFARIRREQAKVEAYNKAQTEAVQPPVVVKLTRTK